MRLSQTINTYRGKFHCFLLAAEKFQIISGMFFLLFMLLAANLFTTISHPPGESTGDC